MASPGGNEFPPMSSSAPAPVPAPQEEAPAVDIISIENLQSKMPKWNPSSPNQLYALVDMGSNGIRFSISDLSPPQARLLPCIYQERAPISLLDALLESQPASGSGSSSRGGDKFPVATIHAVSKAVARFRSIALEGYGVPAANMTIFATEAMRRASNAAAMLDAIRESAPDLAVHVLDPRVETLFGAMGARAGFVSVRGLFLDLGGGSLQVSYVDSSSGIDSAASVSSSSYSAPTDPTNPSANRGGGATGTTTESTSLLHYGVRAALAGQSLPFGAARMTHIIEHEKAAVLDAETTSLRSGLSSALQKLHQQHPELLSTTAPPVDLFLYGGGFRGHGSMLLFNDPIQPYPFPTVASYSASAKHFSDTKKMRRVNRKHDGKIPGMSRRRRQQFPAVATVVEALSDTLGGGGRRIGRVTFCAGGNREGFLLMSLPEDVREQNPLALLAESSPSWLPPVSGGPLAAALRGAAPNTAVTTSALLESVTTTLIEALPESVAELRKPTNVFALGLSPLLARQIWSGAGREDADDMHCASEALHAALSRDPGAAGLGHVPRAVLACTLVSRFGGAVPAYDRPLLESLRGMVSAADPDGSPLFWADYIGIAAAAVARVATAWPRGLLLEESGGAGGAGGGTGHPPSVGAMLRFRPSSVVKFGKENISLAMDVVLPEVLDFDTTELTAPFKRLWKMDGKKVFATAQVVQAFCGDVPHPPAAGA